MLRVGLTGDLGSGKSTVARLLAERGAIVLSSDEMGRALMQPGQPIFNAIVQHFGPEVVTPSGTLHRPRLAELAFDASHPRVEELNDLIHPAVLAAQAEQIAALEVSHPHAIVVVESALIFSTHAAGNAGWQTRFDIILLVTAPEEQKIARFVARNSAGRDLPAETRAVLEADARARLALQQTEAHAGECFIVRNETTPADLETQVESVWEHLRQLEAQRPLIP